MQCNRNAERDKYQKELKQELRATAESLGLKRTQELGGNFVDSLSYYRLLIYTSLAPHPANLVLCLVYHLLPMPPSLSFLFRHLLPRVPHAMLRTQLLCNSWLDTSAPRVLVTS